MVTLWLHEGEEPWAGYWSGPMSKRETPHRDVSLETC
jgi:hypothetical protein